MKFTAILLAAGKGSRTGISTPKQFLDLAGSPVFMYPLENFLAAPGISRVIIVCSPSMQERISRIIKRARLREKDQSRITITTGGKERYHSVLSALELCRPSERVMIHDSARPLLHRHDINKIMRMSAKSTAGILPCEKVTDTIKLTDTAGKKVIKNLPRDRLAAATTPQTFPAGLLMKCYDKYLKAGKKITPTDDAEIYLAGGLTVRTCFLDHPNPKITTREDLKLIRKMFPGN